MAQASSPFFEVTKQPSARGHKHKRWPWFVLVVVLLLAAGAGAYYFWQAGHSKSSSNQTAANQQATLNNQIIKLDDEARSGGSSVDKVMADYAALAKSTTNSDDKYKVFLSESLSVMSMGYPDKAISPAQQAYDIKPSADSAGALGDAYAGSGNNDQAKKYYQQAIQYATKAGQSTDYYTQQMEGLK